MNENIENMVTFCRSVCEAAEQELSDWKSEENLQFPNLVTKVNGRLSLDPKLLTEIDQQVRQYVRRHPEYRVSRGAKGGIMKIEVYEKKQAVKAAQEAAKKQIVAQVEAKVANAQVVAPVTAAVLAEPVIVNDEVVSI